MKTLKLFLLAMLTLGMVAACSENDMPGQGTDNSNGQDLLKSKLPGEGVVAGVNGEMQLTGTQWKLAALVDMQTGKSVEPEPKECNKCYTLVFNSDTTATGRSILNELRFAVTPSNIKMLGMTKIWDGENNNVALFYNALHTIDTYEYSEGELKIYYDSKKKYLSYKPLPHGNSVCLWEQVTPDTPSNEQKSRLDIEVKKCTACWWAIGYHYFWAIYAEKLASKDVSLTIKTV
ncbi:MAG: hypothetical protein LBB73_00245 [Dysgonamonadaceae bacterium]|jgi:hypothetical protein|nr:hypothetical protein [Dysgonamonadaceae bacterium]